MAPVCSTPAKCARYNNGVFGIAIGCFVGVLILSALLWFILFKYGFRKSGKRQGEDKLSRRRGSTSSSSEPECFSGVAVDNTLPNRRDAMLPPHMMRWPISREQYEGMDSMSLWKLPPTIARTAEQRQALHKALTRERDHVQLESHARQQQRAREYPGGMRTQLAARGTLRRTAARTDHTEPTEHPDFASSTTLVDSRATSPANTEDVVSETGALNGSVESDEESKTPALPAATHLRCTDADENLWLRLTSPRPSPRAGNRSGARSPFVPIPRYYTPMPNPFADEMTSPPTTPHLPAQHSGDNSRLISASTLDTASLPAPLRTPRQLGRVSLELNPRAPRNRPGSPTFQTVEDEAWREDYEPRSAFEAESASILEHLNIKLNGPRQAPATVRGFDSASPSRSFEGPSTKPKGPRRHCLTDPERGRSAGQVEPKNEAGHAVM